jgi:tRNA1Val (adenine37-N6)-methyltransferase
MGDKAIDPRPPEGGWDWAQPQDGYRFSRDSVLLAEHAPMFMEGGAAADLGAGCGVVGLEALAKGRLRGLKKLFLVEIQEDFRNSLIANIAAASQLLPDPPMMEAVFRDWRGLSPLDFRGRLDYITCNPPYVAAGRGRGAAGPRGQARMELNGGLEELLLACKAILRPEGALDLSLPARRLHELAGLARKSGWAVAIIRFPPGARSPVMLARLVAAPGNF